MKDNIILLIINQLFFSLKYIIIFILINKIPQYLKILRTYYHTISFERFKQQISCLKSFIIKSYNIKKNPAHTLKFCAYQYHI